MRTNGAVFWRQYIFWHDSGTRIDSGAVYLFMSPGAILACWRCWQAWRQTRRLENIFLMYHSLTLGISLTFRQGKNLPLPFTGPPYNSYTPRQAAQSGGPIYQPMSAVELDPCTLIQDSHSYTYVGPQRLYLSSSKLPSANTLKLQLFGCAVW
jgi:hypothetical protein